MVTGQWNENLSDSFLTLKSTRDIQKNEELLISYGEINNHELLAKYGFMINDNPYSEMKISLDFDLNDYSNFASEQFLLKQRILLSK